MIRFFRRMKEAGVVALPFAFIIASLPALSKAETFAHAVQLLRDNWIVIAQGTIFLCVVGGILYAIGVWMGLVKE